MFYVEVDLVCYFRPLRSLDRLSEEEKGSGQSDQEGNNDLLQGRHFEHILLRERDVREVCCIEYVKDQQDAVPARHLGRTAVSLSGPARGIRALFHTLLSVRTSYINILGGQHVSHSSLYLFRNHGERHSRIARIEVD